MFVCPYEEERAGVRTATTFLGPVLRAARLDPLVVV
jgi:hypothetical protein